MDTRLTRSTNDKMLAGVCGGLARYFGIDSTVVRLVFALAVISGLSPLVYIILWIVMPQESAAGFQPSQPQPMIQADPTGEWQFDPYTGQPIKK
jgi:phage shock protein C